MLGPIVSEYFLSVMNKSLTDTQYRLLSTDNPSWLRAFLNMETITTRSLIQVVILTLCLTIKQRSQHCSQSSASRTEVDTNPVGASFVATLPAGAGVQGSLSGTTNDGGHGTAWEASFTNLPSAGGPFRMFLPLSLQ